MPTLLCWIKEIVIFALSNVKQKLDKHMFQKEILLSVMSIPGISNYW